MEKLGFKIKKYYEIYKHWKHEKIRIFAQLYANLIIKQIDNSKSVRELEHLISQGINLDSLMIYKYNIFLD